MSSQFELGHEQTSIFGGGRVCSGKETFLTRTKNTFSLFWSKDASKKSMITIEDQEENASVTVFSLGLDASEKLFTVNTENIFECWSFENGKLEYSWKGPAAPIVCMLHHSTLPLLATGSADHSVRVWDSKREYCTHSFKGVHGAIPTALCWHPSLLYLVSGADDGSLGIWSLDDNGLINGFHDHNSAITSCAFAPLKSNDPKSPRSSLLMTAGRDKIVNVYRPMKNGKFEKISTLPILWSIESCGWLDSERIWIAGEDGKLEIWNFKSMTKIVESKVSGDEHHFISQCLLFAGGYFVVFTSDLLVFWINSSDLTLTSTIVGHQGEITDIAAFSDEKIIIAANSPQLRMYPNRQSLDCTLLFGHSAAIVSLASNKEGYFVSGSRDNSAIVWNASGTALHHLHGHTDVVGAVAMGESYVATASADLTLKCWSLLEGHSRWTIKAHDKDINRVIISPKDKFIISCSQDKTAKVWLRESGDMHTSMIGHKRGIWDCAVSPIEKVLATASADRTIKLWSIDDGRCLKTLEGHSQSVLKIAFLESGTEIVSAGNDGLIKVWDLKKGECTLTMDAHDDRIWALQMVADGFFTGDASGTLKLWKNVSEEKRMQERKESDEKIVMEQDLLNLLKKQDYEKAIIIALKLEQPGRLYKILNTIYRKGSNQVFIEKILVNLTQDQQKLLLEWAREWNCTLKRSFVAQTLLNTLIKNGSCQEQDEILTQMHAYGLRHVEKINDLLISSYLVDHLINKIK